MAKCIISQLLLHITAWFTNLWNQMPIKKIMELLEPWSLFLFCQMQLARNYQKGGKWLQCCIHTKWLSKTKKHVAANLRAICYDMSQNVSIADADSVLFWWPRCMVNTHNSHWKLVVYFLTLILHFILWSLLNATSWVAYYAIYNELPHLALCFILTWFRGYYRLQTNNDLIALNDPIELYVQYMLSCVTEGKIELKLNMILWF